MANLIAIRLVAAGEVSKFTEAVEMPLPPNKKHKPGRKKGDIIHLPMPLAKEAVATGRWEWVNGAPKEDKPKDETKPKKEKSE